MFDTIQSQYISYYYKQMHSTTNFINHRPKYEGQIIPKRHQIVDQDISFLKNNKRTITLDPCKDKEPQFRQQSRIYQYRNSKLADIFKNKDIQQIRKFEELSQICQRHQLISISKVLDQCGYNILKAFTKLIDIKPDQKEEYRIKQQKQNTDNVYHQKENLPKLRHQFLHMSKENLQMINKFYRGNYNSCKYFILEYLEEKKNKEISGMKKAENHKRASPCQSYNRLQTKEKSNIHSCELNKIRLSDLRDEIDYLFKDKTRYQLFKKDISNRSSRTDIDRQIKQITMNINRLSSEARQAQIERMVATSCFKIDLHGYRGEEIEPLFDMIKYTILQEYKKGNKKILLKKIDGKRTVCVTAMTGKGQHSPDNKSVLKKALKDWCEDQQFEPRESEDQLYIYVPVDG